MGFLHPGLAEASPPPLTASGGFGRWLTAGIRRLLPPPLSSIVLLFSTQPGGSSFFALRDEGRSKRASTRCPPISLDSSCCLFHVCIVRPGALDFNLQTWRALALPLTPLGFHVEGGVQAPRRRAARSCPPFDVTSVFAALICLHQSLAAAAESCTGGPRRERSAATNIWRRPSISSLLSRQQQVLDPGCDLQPREEPTAQPFIGEHPSQDA